MAGFWRPLRAAVGGSCPPSLRHCEPCSNYVTVEIQGQSKGQKGNPINNAVISNLMRFGILVQFPLRMHVLSCSVTDKFCAMLIFKKDVHSKIDALIKT